MLTRAHVFFCFFLFLFFSAVSSASPAKLPSKVVVRSEESRWIAELISQASDGWPELAARKTFPTKPMAEEQARQFETQNSWQIQPEILFEPRMVAGNLWPTKETWSEEWEQRYARWIESEVDTEFFVRYKIATDCADVAYSLRWIFARIHGLPAAARLSGANFLMSNETLRTEWSQLPTASEWHQDRRFRAALNYLLNLTYTHTLWEDSFPVALNRLALLSGSYHLNLHDSSGHTQLIHWLGQGGDVPFLTLNSTVPRQVRSLMDSMLYTSSYPKNKQSAILRFRWAVKNASGIILKKASEMPGYSLEQYSFQSDQSFNIALFEKLGFTGGYEAILNYLFKDLDAQFRARLTVVQEGFEKCQVLDCKPGTGNWENWSTPSRDSQIRGKIASMSSISSGTNSLKPNPIETKEVILLEGASWNVKALIWNWRHFNFSSDPRDPIADRWGAGQESWAQQQKKYFSDKIQERLGHLEKSQTLCQKKDCSLGSEAWETTSSNKIDIEIMKKHEYIVNGASVLPAGPLALLAAQGNEILGEVRGTPITLNHLLNHRLNMNSSATASFEDQWAFGARPLMQMKSDVMGPYFDKWLFDAKVKHLYDRETGERIQLDGAEILAAFKHEPILILRQLKEWTGTLELFHLATGQRNPLPLQDFPEGVRLLTSTSGRLISQSNFLGTQIWNLNVQNLTLKLVFQIPDMNWNLVAGDFLTGMSAQSLDLSNLKFIDAHLDSKPFFLSEKLAGFNDLLSGQKFLWDRVLAKKKPLQLGLLESIVHMTSDGALLVTTINGKTQVYHIDSQHNISSVESIPAFCQRNLNEYFVCYNESGNTFYKNQNGQFIKVLSGPNLVWITDDYLATTVSFPMMEITDRKTQKLLFTGNAAEYISGSYIMVKTDFEKFTHIVDLNNPEQALFTNFSPFSVGTSVVEKNGDLILVNSYSMTNPVLWKKR